jgi:hypothetical protein
MNQLEPEIRRVSKPGLSFVKVYSIICWKAMDPKYIIQNQA